MNFTLTLVNVLIMMAYAVPGFILVKCRAVKGESISAFAKVLLFVCQPCLSLYSFNKADYTAELFADMCIFFGISLLLQAIVLTVLFFIFRIKYSDAGYRVATAACVFGNVGFLGVPLLEALLPQYPDAIAFSAMYILSMNLLSWTVGSAILTGDKKYVSVKKALLTPPILTLIVALPLFFTCTKLPSVIDGSVALLGKMTTPLCMLIMGMRLALAPARQLFNDWKIYFSAIVKLAVFPLAGLLIATVIPVSEYVRTTLFILSCCPTASVVLNLAEMYGQGQQNAANAVLTCTIFSALTIPIMLLII